MAEPFDFGAWRMGRDGKAHHYVNGKPMCKKRGAADTGEDVPKQPGTCHQIRVCKHDCAACLEAVERRWVEMY